MKQYKKLLQYEHELEQHKMLSVTASNEEIVIYLADEKNNLVQQEIGFLQTSVLPGIYWVQFGLNGEKRQIHLTKDMEISQ
jgi:hypothetical protein